jgi:hypothetical protein
VRDKQCGENNNVVMSNIMNMGVEYQCVSISMVMTKYRGIRSWRRRMVHISGNKRRKYRNNIGRRAQALA